MRSRKASHAVLDAYKSFDDADVPVLLPDGSTLHPEPVIEHQWSCDGAEWLVYKVADGCTTLCDADGARYFLRTSRGKLVLDIDEITDSDGDPWCSDEADTATLTEDAALWLLEVLPKALEKLAEQKSDAAKRALRERLRDTIRSSGKSLKQIAEESGVTQESICFFLDGTDRDTVWLSSVAKNVGFW